MTVAASPFKAIPKDHPHRREIARLERDMQAAVTLALTLYGRDIFRGATRENARLLPDKAKDRDIVERLRVALYTALLPVVRSGANIGRELVEREIYGVKAVGDLAIDWTLVDQNAVDIARRMAFELTYANVYSITDSTAAALRAAIAGFIEEPGMTMNQLSRQVEGLFDAARGEMIAITEVTRAFAAGNQAAWETSRVVEGKQWNTAVDELVCPICAPLNGKVVGLNETFNGAYDYPPAHPRCRCWISPVVIQPEQINEGFEQQLLNQEIAELLQSTPESDPFYYIRPPEGRAPRGMGQEYADRRWIVNSLEKAQQYRGTAQRKLEQYRGQHNRAWEMSVAQDRVQELTKAINASLDIVETNADWAFKRDMVSAIMEYAKQLGAMGR